jgi:uncharacterized membrane protein
VTLSLPLLDASSLALFCALWLGYGPAARWIGQGTTINTGLHSIRVLWMRSMLRRENRIVDSARIGHVVHSASFFASTSLIAIGALLGILTGLDRIQPAIDGLSMVAPVPRQLLEIKVMLPMAVLVHGLFKLTWSLRQLNYTVALIGAAPPTTASSSPEREAMADAIGGVLTSASLTFNDGIRSYYFAIVGLTWLAGPWWLAGASLWLVGLLFHRQLASKVSRQFRRARALVEAEHRADRDPPQP